MGKRIVFTSFGSLGDIHPYMAIALALQARGYQAFIATSEFYRSKITTAGIGFYPVRPDIPGFTEELMRHVMDRWKGTERILREFLLPHLRASYEDLSAAVRGMDLLVTHPVTFAGPIVAATTGIPWISTVLSPASLLSAYDPSVMPALPFAETLAKLGRRLNGGLIRLAHRTTSTWMKPVYELRAELGLPPGKHPIFEGSHSPARVLALFSSVLASPQPDWPPQTRVAGFPFYDGHKSGAAEPAELTRFLDAGPPPVVFTLGSSAVYDPGSFYHESVRAVRTVGCRAVLLAGNEAANLRRNGLPQGVAAFDYAPYSQVLPRAAVIVHQGGIGTTGQALRAGRPTLVMPLSHDQPDNAARLARLGVSRTIGRNRYTASRVTAELNTLLNDSRYSERAADIGRRIQSEDGVEQACNTIEERLE